MRLLRSIRLVFPLIAFGLFWWQRPEEVAPLLQYGFPVNLGSSQQPHEVLVPAVVLLVAPLALRFALPLILRLALFLPYGAAALSRPTGRRATFDPALDLPADSLGSGSRQQIAVDRAIAAALAARNGVPAPPTQARSPAFGGAERAPGAGVAPRPAPRPFGRGGAAA